MIERIRKKSQLQVLKDRNNYLEDLNRRLISILDVLASNRDFQASINRDRDPATILTATCLQMNRLLAFQAMAFLTVNEADHSFIIKDCEPPSRRSLIQDEVDNKIIGGEFAWALNQNRPVIAPANNPEHTVILHVIETQSQTMGMFIGILPNKQFNVNDPSLNALSIILLNAAYALESAALYQLLNNQMQDLEAEIQKRTQELKKAREQLEMANIAKSQFLANNEP
jgi:hypothetical protein